MKHDLIKRNIVLSPYTTLKVGGPAEHFACVTTEEELREVIGEADRLGLPIFVLGGGSNLLINDEGVKGVVVKNAIAGVSFAENGGEVLVTAGAGVVWDELVKETVARGYWGLENLSSIPGTVGGTPVQNVGAYGIEVGELITAVRVYDVKTREFSVMSNGDCSFGYRDSFFKTTQGRHLIVTAVTYRLSTEPRPRLHYKDLAQHFTNVTEPNLLNIREAVIEIRAGKFPDWKVIGTAGSFFKNPIVPKELSEELIHQYPDLPVFPYNNEQVKVSLGYILDKICGLRGAREGKVGLYDQQALVLVNFGNATASEINIFANKISEIVFAKTKIKIEREVNTI